MKDFAENEIPTGFDALLNTSTPFAPSSEEDARRRLLPPPSQEAREEAQTGESVQDQEFAALFQLPEPVETTAQLRPLPSEAAAVLGAPEDVESDDEDYAAVQAALRRSAANGELLDGALAQKAISLRSADGGVRVEASGTGVIRSVTIAKESVGPSSIRSLGGELVRLLNQVSTTAGEWEAAERRRIEEREA